MTENELLNIRLFFEIALCLVIFVMSYIIIIFVRTDKKRICPFESGTEIGVGQVETLIRRVFNYSKYEIFNILAVELSNDLMEQDWNCIAITTTKLIDTCYNNDYNDLSKFTYKAKKLSLYLEDEYRDSVKKEILGILRHFKEQQQEQNLYDKTVEITININSKLNSLFNSFISEAIRFSGENNE